MNILRNNTLNMLLACGSPGSALAYHLKPALVQPGLMHRNMAGETQANGVAEAAAVVAPADTSAAIAPFSVWGWIMGVFDYLERRSWEHEMRERETYLAGAQNVFDLENRMRELESGRYHGEGTFH
jgi:hypothetical protein